MAASITARIREIRNDVIKECFCDFQHTEHRLETIANIHGIEFINDSKATNVNAAWFALESMLKPVIWITGGTDELLDYGLLKPLVKNKVRAIIFLGSNSSKIRSELADLEIPFTDVLSMDEAVEASYTSGRKGDVVLLSPGCASFNYFKNFEERGKAFTKAVKYL